MMSAGFGIFGLLGFVVLAAQIVGLVGLAKAGRTSAWWVMACGVGCSVIGILSSILMMVGAMSGWGSNGVSGMTMFWVAGAGLNGLGSLLFGAGFGMHGMRASRVSNRQAELEMLVQAQTEEIRRLSGGVR
jgi:hypothetical protein